MGNKEEIKRYIPKELGYLPLEMIKGIIEFDSSVKERLEKVEVNESYLLVQIEKYSYLVKVKISELVEAGIIQK
jgi:hypothetical protein